MPLPEARTELLRQLAGELVRTEGFSFGMKDFRLGIGDENCKLTGVDDYLGRLCVAMNQKYVPLSGKERLKFAEFLGSASIEIREASGAESNG